MLIGYMGIMVYMGILSERGMVKGVSGYLLANRTATLPWIIMSIFATGVGTLAYIGTVGMISGGGVIDLWFEFFWCIGTPIMTLLFARKLRTSGIISFWDSLAFRYGPITMLVYAGFMIVAVPFGFAQMLKGAGLTFTDMFPILEGFRFIDPVVLGALIVLAVISLYLAFGGFKACLVTDMMQGILTWAAMIVPTAAIFFILGEGNPIAGWHYIVSFFQTHQMSEYLQFSKVVGPTAPASEYTYSFIFAMMIMNVLLIMLPGGFYGSRYMAAKNERTARQGPILALILTTVPYGLFVNITGLAFKAYAPEIPGDELFTGTLKKLAATQAIPMMASSLLLIALLAAVMGTLDSSLMARMSNYVRGIYNLWLNPKASQRQLIRASRVILLILVVVAMISAFIMPPSIWFLNLAISAIVGPMSFVLIIGAFLVRRTTWQGALAGGLISSGLALLFTAILTGFNNQYPWMIWEALRSVWPPWLHSQFFTYPIGIMAFLWINHRLPPMRPEQIERFFSAVKTAEYVKKFAFDRSYSIVKRDILDEAQGFEVRSFGKELRLYGPEEGLRKFAAKHNLRYYPPYRRYESWKEVLDRRLLGMYSHGLDVAAQREEEHTGEHERRAAKAVGGLIMALAISIYFGMFWYFPLQWRISLLLYLLGSGLMFAALCIFFEDYRWARRVVDLFTKERRVQAP